MYFPIFQVGYLSFQEQTNHVTLITKPLQISEAAFMTHYSALLKYFVFVK